MVFKLVYVSATDFFFYGRYQASYFSLSGIYLGAFVYLLLVVSHYQRDKNLSQNTNDSSMWYLWKWCNFAIVLYFNWQFLITSSYWFFFYWDHQKNLKMQPNAVQASYYLGHSLPALLIMFDMWFCNSVTFVFSHSFVIVGVFVVYFIGFNFLIFVFG